MQRRYRVLLWSALALVLLPLLLAAALYALANTDVGRRAVERATASLTHGNVRLSGLGGHFPEQLTLARLELRDPQGLWLAIDDLRLQWRPSALLSYRADVALLSAGHVDMPRAPAYPSDHKPSRSHHWPQVRIARLEVARADLGAPLTGSAVAFEMSGSGVWMSLQQASLQLEARRLDAVPSVYRASAQFDSQQLLAQLDLQEDADGPLAHLAQLPTIGALAIHLSLEGPREAVRTVLSLRAGAATAAVSGTLNARSGASDLNLTLDADAMSPRPGISWKSIHLKGRWQGALDAPQTSASLEASGVAVPGVLLPLLSATLSGQGGTLTLDARAAGLTVAGKIGALLAGAPLTARATLHLKEPGRPIDITAAHALLNAAGRWSGTGADGSATLSATINDLKPFAALAALDLTGRGTLEAQLHTRPQTSSLALSGTLGHQRWQLAAGAAAGVEGQLRWCHGLRAERSRHLACTADLVTAAGGGARSLRRRRAGPGMEAGAARPRGAVAQACRQRDGAGQPGRRGAPVRAGCGCRRSGRGQRHAQRRAAPEAGRTRSAAAAAR